MTIDYDTLTAEGLEEHVEQVDWSIIPSRLITKEVIDLFGTIPKLRARIWFDDLLNKMVIKEDQEEYSDQVFFFIEGKYFMNSCSVIDNLFLYCSYDNIWSFFEQKCNFSYYETRALIFNMIIHFEKNDEKKFLILKHLLKTTDMKIVWRKVDGNNFIEQHFNKIKYSIESSIVTVRHE